LKETELTLGACDVPSAGSTVGKGNRTRKDTTVMTEELVPRGIAILSASEVIPTEARQHLDVIHDGANEKERARAFIGAWESVPDEAKQQFERDEKSTLLEAYLAAKYIVDRQ
jgi:hypothetical protein